MILATNLHVMLITLSLHRTGLIYDLFQLSDQGGRRHKMIKAAVAGRGTIPYEDSNAR